MSLEASPRPRNGHGYIPTLDGWRAIAIILVIGAHCQTMLINSGFSAGRIAAAALKKTGFGVDVFFALSGFLITLLLLRERDKRGTIDLKGFYIRRVFRIIPPMAIYLLTIAALGFGNILPVTGREVAGSLAFARNYMSGSWYTGHFWSLSIEEHFYAVIPCLLLLLSRRRQVLLILSVALIALCIATRAYELAHRDVFGSLAQFRTENRVDALLWGSIFAQLWAWPAARPLLDRLLAPRAVALFFAAAALAMALTQGQADHRTIAAAILPLLIVHTVRHSDGRLGRLLETAPLRFVGRLSYSLYIWQMLFLVEGPRRLGRLQDFPLALILPVVLAITSYYMIERPMIALGRRLSARGLALEKPRLEPATS
ncbi:MAG TPA: acyltransferase [Sphingomonas sp.]|nr:acyltransferase [Sphingomonas sp.]